MATAPRLPDYRGGQPTALRGGRLPASEINRMAPTVRERTITVAAHGEPIPIVYGRANVPGLLFAQGMIGSDLVLGYALCVGEIDAIEMVQINDVDASTITGVTVTKYLGTPTQAVDATLAAAIPAYNDSLRYDEGNGWRGIAYVVLRITTAAGVGGFPRMRATIRGRKLYDPRSGLTAYSDNSALCMADLISDVDYGLGMTADNVAAAANWCDSLLADAVTKRSRLSLVLDRPAQIESWLDLLSAYAECFYTYSGASVRLIPDGAVDLSTVPRLDAAWIAETLRVRYEDTADSPGAVELVYTVPRTDALPWSTASAKRGITGSDQPPTTVRMLGVYSLSEADNKALARLNRTRSRVSVSFVTADIGVSYQIGDVIVLSSPARGIVDLPVRVLSIDMQEPGRYQISGERYDENHYPAEAPVVTTLQLPDGAILLDSGAVLPDGYAAFTAANGRYIVGAGGAYSAGQTGGAASTAAWSDVTGYGGDHSGGTAIPVARPGSMFPGYYTTAGGFNESNHRHSWTAPAVTMDPLRVRRKLAKRSGSSLVIPASLMVFGVAGLSHPSVARITADTGRLLMADSGNGTAGYAAKYVAATVATANMPHKHHVTEYGMIDQDFAPYPDLRVAADSGQWPHTHTLTVRLAVSAKRRGLALYGGSGDYPVLAGMIVMHDGAVPAGWVLCDGTNGTPDMRDFFVEFAASGQEGVAAGNNTVVASGQTNDWGHSHYGSDATDGPMVGGVPHANTATHRHDIQASQPYIPPFYALNFIMCVSGA